MSDSETDLFPTNNVYTFRNESTMVSAKGPNINSTNITGINFRTNMLSSTMQPRNFERPRFAESNCDQRSMYYRRETSPMSMYSGSDMRARNFHHSFYPNGLSSQRSMYSGRGGSPVSMRSIDSNASVSAVDIAMAFKNVNFNKYDLRIIKDAYNKLMKRKIRKKVEKRRNMRLFLKGYRRKSGYDSGEQGSDSSLSSSDDCKSTKSIMCKDNLSSYRSSRSDITNFRHTMKQSNIYNDCTDNFKSNALKNMFSAHPSRSQDGFNNQMYDMSREIQNVPNTITSMKNGPNTIPATKNWPNVPEKTKNVRDQAQNSTKTTTKTKQNAQNFNQRDRFKSGFLLPSQRFNSSVASVPILEKEVDINKSTSKLNKESKRCLETEDICSDNKRKKLSSSQKQTVTNNKVNHVLKESNNNKDTTNNEKEDFEFIKPQFPVRKSGPGKTKEMLISKSNVPLTDAIIPQTVMPVEHCGKSKQDNSTDKLVKKHIEEQSDTVNQSNDISTRPSFIKRKLFTQKMDVTESKNLSNDAINVNSPGTGVYSTIQREKSKARKLVTSQSCLNRDVNQEESNFLDLIHMIVPPEHMNVTNVSNKTHVSNKNHENKKYDDDKWDVTSVISTCNNDDVSDTYTDEEIFGDNSKRNENLKVKSKPAKSLKKNTECKVVLEKISQNDLAKTKITDCVKSFWDTDFESDFESSIPKKSELNISSKSSKFQERGNISNSSKDITILENITKETQHTQELTKDISEHRKQTQVPEARGTHINFNIGKNLTFKAFGTLKANNIKTTKTSKEATKTTEKKKAIASKEQNGIDTTKKNQMPVENESNKIQNNKLPLKLDKAKVQKSQSKVKSSNSIQTMKPKSCNALNKSDNNGILSRSRRISKIKLCCGSENDKEKNNSTPELKTKVDKQTKVDNTKTKSTTTKKSNKVESIADKENSKQSRNQKVLADHKIVTEIEPLNRILRTRVIDLSSSLNSSSDSIANITVRSLRTRRINLSSSINNSTLNGNDSVIKNKLQKMPPSKTHLRSIGLKGEVKT